MNIIPFETKYKRTKKFQKTETGKRKRTESGASPGSSADVVSAGLDPKIVKAIKQMINKSIDAKVETKQAYHTQTPTDFNSAISVAGDCMRLIPNIAQGTDGHTRLGDYIEPISLNMRMILQMLPQGNNQSASVCKLAVRAMIITPKQFPNWAAASANTATWMPQLLKKGGTTVGFTGDISDLFCPYNVEAITCHWQKVYYFNQPWATSTASSIALDQSSLVTFVNKTIRLKGKKFHYSADVDGGLTPTDAGYFLVIGYAFVDGTSPDTLSTRVRVQFDNVLNFQDA